MQGDRRDVQFAVLSAIALLIVALCAVVVAGINRNRPAILETVGIPTVPPVDRSKAFSKVRAPNIQAVLADPGNYPIDALRNGDQGAVAALLTIAPSGVVEDCRISLSSKHASLDNATCQIARDRIRFEPARDGKGAAIPATFSLRVRWVLPDE